MQRNVWRAFLLAMTMMIVGALPAMAQSQDGWLLAAEDDSVLIGIQRDLTVAPTETTDGVVIVDGNALILGAVERLFAVDANVTLSGAAASVQDIFTIGGSLVVETGATVGNGYQTGTEVTVSPTAIVEGEIVDAQDELVGALAAIVALLVVGLIFIIIGGVIAWLAVTLLVIAFGTQQVRRAAATISHDVLKTIVVGLLMLILPSIVFGLLFVTIVGIPLAIGLMLLWGLVVGLGQIVVAVWIGERILPRARSANRPYGAAFLGMLILLLLSWTGVVPLLAGIFGTGAATLTGWRVLRSGGVPPVPPGYIDPYGGYYGQPMPVPPIPYAPPYAPPPTYAPPPPPPGQWPPQGGQPPGAWPQG
ncbi:MAG: hypothetical protein R6W93_13325 [Candidatus Limnocylindrales bacterium]